MTFYMGGTKIRATYKFSGDEASVKYKRGGSTTKGKVALSDMTVSDAPAAMAQPAEETSAAQQVEMKGGLPLGQPPLRTVGEKSVWRKQERHRNLI